MFATQDIPDFFHRITFDNGISVEFNQESTVNFYDSDDEEIMRIDPSDVMIIYQAYRGMVRERCEEDGWRGEESV